MSREIKFRAWHPDYGEDGAGYMFNWKRLRANYNLYAFTNDPGSIMNLMQYTGLKDKNGVEIYEGDILSHFDNSYVVEWDEQMAAFQARNPVDDVDVDFFNWTHIASLRTQGVPSGFSNRDDPNCEVIGNIYENKELLK